MKLYSPEDVAILLGYKPETVRTWLREGRIAGIKINRSWRITQEQLDEFLSKRIEGD